MLRSRARSHLLATPLLLLATGCGTGDSEARESSKGAWPAGQAWRVERQAVIGQDGEVEFGDVVDVALDDAGRVWVADRTQHHVQVFSPDGALVRNIGRKGGGPGEFRSIAGMDWDRSGRLWVMDAINGRFSVWDTAGTLVATHRRENNSSVTPWPLGFDRQGRLYDVLIRDSEVGGIVRYDSLLQPLDTLYLPPYEEPAIERKTQRGNDVAVSRTILPFAPTQAWAFDPDGFMWMAITDRYRIEGRGFGDTVEGVRSRPVSPAAVTRAQRRAAMAQLERLKRQGAAVDPSRLPSVQPVLLNFFVASDGHLWVRTMAGNGYGYDVFSPSGTYLGEVRAPDRLSSSPAPVVRGDYMAGVVTDADGVESVVVMRIVRPGR